MPADIIIRKQRLKVKTNDETYAFKVRKQVNDQLQYDLLPVYEDAFGKINEDLFIDKISINLGVCKLEELNSQLPQKFKHALENWVVEEKRSGRWHQSQSAFQESSLLADKVNKKTDIISALMYYLEKGVYPWWFKSNDKNISSIILGFTETETEQFVSALISSFRSFSNTKREIVITRLLQVQEAVLEKIVIKLISLLNNAQVKEDVLFLTEKQTISALKKWFFISEKKYLKSLLNSLFDIIELKVVFNINSFLLAFIYSTNDSLEKLKIDILNIDNFSNEEEKNLDILPEKLRKIITETYAAFVLDDINESSKNLIDNSRAQNLDSNEPVVSEIFSEEEAVYIINAGLVILHPFLVSLFEELKLLDADRNFLSDECRYKAIVLLNYLSTGKDEYDEPDLVFNKILCGSTPEKNLPDEILLTENEKKECDQLLEVVINYWEVLKGSGKEALRETFLRHNGKLSFNDKHYLLQVEKNATDILIDRLPWGIGIIQLPWSGYLIYVEW